MPDFLGFDTSNYTTSCAVFRSETNEVFQQKKLLPVKSGEVGLRQSDAVFHHTKQLPPLLNTLIAECGTVNIDSICASCKPRLLEGSYMPCFLVGEGVADNISSVMSVTCFKTSHQIGHILAALYSSGRLDYIHKSEPFIAFHVSGGTTDVLLCTPCEESVLKVDEIASSLDLKAGQAVDRVGIMLGLDFPCGTGLEKLALKADKHFKCKPVIRNGCCCLSGLENKCKELLDNGESRENIAAFCLDFVCETIIEMTNYAIEKFRKLNIVYAGGVMSDKILQKKLSQKFDAEFAKPEFSCDNAVGIAVYAAIKRGLI